MIELKSISKTYHNTQRADVKALDNINLKLNKTGMVFILGKSGSGKSTLLNLIGGLDKPDSGDFLINGKSLSNFSFSDFDKYRNTFIGFVFQEYNILDELTVSQNLGLALELQGKKIEDEVIDKYLALVDLVGFGKRKPNELSGGQKQRVAIARALVKNPDIIMADEPTGALDTQTGSQVLDTLEKLSKERLVIVVSHDKDYAKKYATRIIELSDGKIVNDISKVNGKLAVENNSFIFTDNGIEVKEGHELTKEDLKSIHTYYQNVKNNESLISSSLFEQTNENEIITEIKSFTLIKSQWPIIKSISMGLRSLKNKKVRLLFAVLLLSFSLILFGITNTFTDYNEATAIKATLKASGDSFVSFSKRNIEKYDNGSTSYGSVDFDNGENITLSNEVGGYFHPLYKTGGVGGLYHFDFISEKNSRYYYSNIDLITNINNDAKEKLGLNLVAGTLPDGIKDIVITKYQFDLLKKFGYRSQSNQKILINNYDDMLGKFVHIYGVNYRVTGIIDTNFNNEKYIELIDKEDINNDINYIQLTYEMLYNVHNAFFLSNDGFENYQNPYEIDIVRKFNLYTGLETQNNHIITFDKVHFLERKFDKAMLLFKNKEVASLEDNDIIIPINLFDRILEQEIMNEFSDFMRYEIEVENKYSDEIIYQTLLIIAPNLEVKPLNMWDDRYRKDMIFALIQYSVHYLYINETIPNFYTDEFMLDTFIKPKIENLEKLSETLSIYDYNTQTETLKTVNIVGLLLDESSVLNSTFAAKEIFFKNYKESKNDYQPNILFSSLTENDSLDATVSLHLFSNESLDYKMNTMNINIIDSFSFMLVDLPKVTNIIGIIFLIFAGLLMFSFISSSIQFKRKEIGILRSLGASGVDIFKIFISESVLIAFLTFLIAVISTPLIINFLSKSMTQSMQTEIVLIVFTYKQVFVLALVSLLSAVISTIVPIIKFSFKKPIDIINQK